MKYIAEQYGNYEYPLVPSAEDIVAYQSYIDEYVTSFKGENIRVLICGVTPHLVNLRFPENTFILGVDFSEDMVKYVWPGDIPGRRKAIRENWLTMDIDTNSIDIILGDGSLNFLDEKSYHIFCKKAVEILKPKGIMVKRTYLQGADVDPAERYKQIFQKKYENLTEFRLKFMKSVQKNSLDGVRMDDVFKAWESLGPNLEVIENETGYDVSILRGMDLYKDKDVKLYFHPLDFHQHVLANYFSQFDVTFPQTCMSTELPIFCVKEKI